MTPPVTVVCVWVNGQVPYGVEYVVNLERMVRRHLSQARFVCLTDRPRQVPAGIMTVSIAPPGHLYGWWRKLEVFRDLPELTQRVLYLDLDSLIVGPLLPIIRVPAPFALLEHAGTFTGWYRGQQRQVIPRYNSSVMVFDRGYPRRLVEDWTPAAAERLHGDQDWIGERWPEAATLPPEWCPRLSDLGDMPPGPDAKVVLCKRPKNAIAAERYPWVAAVWRAA